MEHEENTRINSMVIKMLETRQKHARMQTKDYSHVFRKKTSFEILKLSSLALGIGFVIAAETAFVSPILLQIGIDHTTMTMVWGLSPILGLLLGPFIGSISDRCRLNYGRRRPVILLLALGMIIGIFFLLFGRNIGQLFCDGQLEGNITEIRPETQLPTDQRSNLKLVLIFTVLGTVLFDFCMETCHNPVRAYMLDVSILEDQRKVLSSFSVMIGLGSTVGYIIGGINWESTAIGRLLGGNIQTVFMIDAFIFVVSLLITFFSFSEIPLSLSEKDELLRPLTETMIKKDISKNTVQNEGTFLLESLKICENIDADLETISLGKYLKSIIVMPKSMWILCLTNLFCWMGHISYCLYFTDFVGEAVFHGDPGAPVGTEKYNLYDAGVRHGGWGMAVYALSCSVYSLIIEKLMIKFKLKFIYFYGILVFAIGMFILAAWPNKIGVLILSVTGGIIFGTIYTVPFIIVANYHSKNCFELRKGKNIPLNQPRGLGTDIAIINSMLCVAQLIISLSIGYLVSWTGTTSAIFYAASVFSLCGAVSAMFILYI